MAAHNYAVSEGAIQFREALSRCTAAGKPMSENGLRDAGRIFRFIQKAPDGYHSEIIEMIFSDWLSQRANADSGANGFVSVTQAAIHAKAKNVQSIYLWIRLGELESLRIGPGRGKIYVRIEDVKKLVDGSRRA